VIDQRPALHATQARRELAQVRTGAAGQVEHRQGRRLAAQPCREAPEIERRGRGSARLAIEGFAQGQPIGTEGIH